MTVDVASLPQMPGDLGCALLSDILGRGVERMSIVDQIDRAASHCARLAIAYSGGAETILFAKLTKAEPRLTFVPWAAQLPAMNRNEMDFYGAGGPATPVPRCRGMASDADGRMLLLLDDLTASHDTGGDPECCIGTLALVHAAWWEHPWLGKRVGARLQPRVMTRDRAVCELSVHDAALAASVHARLPEILAFGGPLTLTHGDVNPTNFLCPREAQGQAILVDWQTSRAGMAVDDLAMLLVPQAARDDTLLRHWHDVILSCGITYSWDALRRDYADAVLRFLAYALFSWTVDDIVVGRALAAARRHGLAEHRA